MKKSIVLLLAILILLCACEKKQEIELGGYLSENGYWYMDPESPTVEAPKKEIKVTLSDGTTDTSYMKRPILNVDTEGANSVTDVIKNYLDDNYGKYFKKPDDRIVKVDYTTGYENDILTVVITEEIITPDSTSKKSTAFYYDALSDVELNMLEYTNTNGAQLSTVYKALLDSDWAKEYEAETGNLPYEDIITAINYKGDLVFDVYCTNPDGLTETVLELQVEDVPFTIPGMEDYYA